MAGVQLENVSKIYSGGVKAVDDVSLSIADHEFVVLVGPSGCGKSTTLRLVAGLETPDDGLVRIGERVVNDVAPKDRDIAMVFQNYALYPHMTVYGNLSFALRLRRMPGLLSRILRPGPARKVKQEIHDRVMRAADMLDIRPLLKRKPRELSGGQRQRVAVGRAIVRDPAAFLFDEPLSNLDARLRISTRAEIKRLHQRLRTTTIYVTHDQEEAMTLGDRIVVMKDGKIQQADPPLITYHYPRNRFVAGFIGMPPMNFFDGTVTRDGDHPSFTERVGGNSGEESASGLTLSRKGFTLSLSRLPASVQERLAGWVGREVVLGVRPEHLSLDPIRADDGSVVSHPLDWRVLLAEPLGSSIDLYLQSAGHEQIVARVEAPVGQKLSALREGSTVKVHVDLRRVHLFEPGETGMNLSLETTSSGQLATELAHAMA